MLSSSLGNLEKGCLVGSHAVPSLGKGFWVVQRCLDILWPPPTFMASEAYSSHRGQVAL